MEGNSVTFTVRAMTTDDFLATMDVWKGSEGIGLTEDDTEGGISSFLERNPFMSAVAVAPSGEVLGAVLCGHDGRRGYLHHLAVNSLYRRQGVASRLIAWCFSNLAAQGIRKCNILLLDNNTTGTAFWEHQGWSHRNDLHVFQKPVTS